MIYVLHFDNPYKGASHYIGFTERSFNARYLEHIKGNGNPLVKAVNKAGINIRLACLIEGDRNRERKLKNRKCTPRWCPVCAKFERPAPGNILISNAVINSE